MSEITNWYSKIKGSGIKNDKNFVKHLIRPNSMMAFIGNTGSGKSNGLVEFLSLKNNAFYQIIYHTASTSDEPLLHLLREHIDGIEILDTLEDLPDLENFRDADKTEEKLVIFDDILNHGVKELKQISHFFTAARKYGFSCIVMAQNYTNIPTTIRRNCSYFFLFKMTDGNTINNIIRTHNLSDVDKDALKKAYLDCIKTPLNFMLIDLTANSPMPFRHNFTKEIKFEKIST